MPWRPGGKPIDREALSHARRVQVTPQPHSVTRHQICYPPDAQQRASPRPVAHHDPHRLCARLMQHLAEPTVDISPQDAARLGVQEGQLTRISAPRGLMVARAKINPGQRDGELFVPMHWNSCFSRQGKVNALVEGRCDPHSGQPESKQTAVQLMPWQPAWQGELYSREELTLPTWVHWWRKATARISRMTLAADKPLLEWLMAHCTGQGWQLQIAQTGERSSVLALA